LSGEYKKTRPTTAISVDAIAGTYIPTHRNTHTCTAWVDRAERHSDLATRALGTVPVVDLSGGRRGGGGWAGRWVRFLSLQARENRAGFAAFGNVTATGVF
jgi:hypothetical protein